MEREDPTQLGPAHRSKRLLRVARLWCVHSLGSMAAQSIATQWKRKQEAPPSGASDAWAAARAGCAADAPRQPRNQPCNQMTWTPGPACTRGSSPSSVGQQAHPMCSAPCSGSRSDWATVRRPRLLPPSLRWRRRCCCRPAQGQLGEALHETHSQEEAAQSTQHPRRPASPGPQDCARCRSFAAPEVVGPIGAGQALMCMCIVHRPIDTQAALQHGALVGGGGHLLVGLEFGGGWVAAAAAGRAPLCPPKVYPSPRAAQLRSIDPIAPAASPDTLPPKPRTPC